MKIEVPVPINACQLLYIYVLVVSRLPLFLRCCRLDFWTVTTLCGMSFN